MHSFTAIFAASALLTAVSGAPHVIRGNTCGAAPAGSNTQNQPIQQRTDIQTAADCQTQCDASTSCQSFLFGLIDNTIQCKLYSVPAASIPKQSSTNLVAYDKACSSVPSVVPTTSNPTGKQVENQNSQQQGTGAKSSGSKTSGQKATESKAAQKTNTQQKRTDKKQSSSANTCGSKPAANTSNQPLSAPSVSSEDACKVKCQADSSCKSFSCGTVNNAFVCKLYSVEAANIPAPTTTAEKNALKAYDVGCSI